MAKVFLHLGYPKTATTSLQTFFTRNSDELRRRENLLYPTTSRVHIGHHGLSMCLNIDTYDGKIRDSAAAKELLNKEIDQSACKTVLISSESFIAAKSLGPVVEFFSGHDLYLVVYLRRHDHALESAYSQSVCLTVSPPWKPGIDNFIQHQTCISSTVPWNYLQTLERFSAAVGKDHVIVRPFEREQNLPDIYADFLLAIGVQDSGSFIRPRIRTNPSLPYHTLITIDAVMRSEVSPSMKQTFSEMLARIGGTKEKGSFLSPQARIAILEKYGPTYAEIARDFMGRDDGVLFTEPALAMDEVWSPPSLPTIKESVDLVLRAQAEIEKATMTLASVSPIAKDVA